MDIYPFHYTTLCSVNQIWDGGTDKIKTAVTEWLSYRLKLQVSEEKTGITNLKKNYCEFLGFKIKLQAKSNKEVVNARMCDKAVKRAKEKLIEQIKLTQKLENDTKLYQAINTYNSMVLGIQNYYEIANNVCRDMNSIQYAINTVIKNRLETEKSGKFNNEYLRKRYGNSKQMRWLMDIPIIPIGYLKSRKPMSRKASINQYTPEGKLKLYKPPDINIAIMQYIMRNPIMGRTVEYNDNRVSLYVGQRGKCAVTGKELEIGKMHCHHKKPTKDGGDDKYNNLTFIIDDVHILIHATQEETISQYLKKLNLGKKQLKKLNELRVMAGLKEVA